MKPSDIFLEELDKKIYSKAALLVADRDWKAVASRSEIRELMETIATQLARKLVDDFKFEDPFHRCHLGEDGICVTCKFRPEGQ